jgi:hypothetical protein
MLTQQQIDALVNASREADEGPTQLVRRVESALLSRWVRVDDRLPEAPDDGADVPVYVWDGETLDAVDYTQTFGFYSRYSGKRKITHWHPRDWPKPPGPNVGTKLPAAPADGQLE